MSDLKGLTGKISGYDCLVGLGRHLSLANTYLNCHTPQHAPSSN